MSISAATSSKVQSFAPLPCISEVYKQIRGDDLPESGTAEWRGYCLSVKHPDSTPSCDYNVDKDTFHCKSCGENGGVLQLVVAAGKAEDKKAATKWLREQGLLAASQDVWRNVGVTYHYRSAEGAVLYEVGRWNLPNGDKTFRQRVPDGKGGYNEAKGSLKGVERVPYRLPELLSHVANTPDVPVYVVEGEKDADNVAAAGGTVTTSAQGARWAWPLAWAEYFRGLSTVYVLADNDEPGRKAADQRASLLATVVPNVQVVHTLPGVGDKGDVSDWLDQNGNDLAALAAICTADGVRAQPYHPTYDVAAVDAVVSDMSDIGAAEWMTHHFGDVTRYVNEAKGWYTYAEGVWSKTDAGWYAIRAANGLRDAAADYSGQGADSFRQFAEASRSQSKRDSILKTAQSLNNGSIALFDAHPTLFNCANGTLDLASGEVHDHDPADMLTLRTPVVYDAEARCPKFEAWLRECVQNDQDLFDYMQQVMGSCLEGRPGLRSFYFIFGPKGTGKSTFIRMLEALLGPYQVATDFSTLTKGRWGADGGAATPQLAMLKGRRMVSAAEAESNQQLNASRVKQLVGGDIVTARYLNQNLFEFRFEATLIMSGNEMPRIVGDESIWDKFKPVPFTHEIEDEDPDFEARELLTELSGILNFAIEGLRKLQASGYKMHEPAAVTKARSEEFAAQDIFADFVSECIKKLDPYSGKHVAVPGSKVREAYVAWAKKMSQPLLLDKAFKAAMKRQGIEPGATGGITTWKNIGLVMPSSSQSDF